MPVPVGLNVWSRLVERTFPYLDKTVAPFESVSHPPATTVQIPAW